MVLREDDGETSYCSAPWRERTVNPRDAGAVGLDAERSVDDSMPLTQRSLREDGPVIVVQ
jgi:hypothetical protein